MVEVILWDTLTVSRAAKNRSWCAITAVTSARTRAWIRATPRAAKELGLGAASARPIRMPPQRVLRDRLRELCGATIGVIVTDSFGRPFREGTVGVAIGVAGMPALDDQRGPRRSRRSNHGGDHDGTG